MSLPRLRVAALAGAVALTALSLDVGRALAQPVEFGAGDDGQAETADEGSADIVLLASRHRQTIQEAPMIVTVITRAQIRSGGFRTVSEILRTIPGFEPTVYQQGRLPQMLSRGQDRSLLFMIDSVPFYWWHFNNPIDVAGPSLDVQMIEKIEVVSGPGGVLWGANALLGVVNIVTRRGGESPSFQEFSLGGGTGPGDLEALRAYAQDSQALGDFGRFNLMLSYRQSRGTRYTVEDSPFFNPGPFIWDQNFTFFGNAGTTENDQIHRIASAMASVQLGDLTLFGYVPFTSHYKFIGISGSLTAADTIEEDLPGHQEILEPLAYARYTHRAPDDRFGFQVTASAQAHNLSSEPNIVHAPGENSLVPFGLAQRVDNKSRRLSLGTEFDAQLFRGNVLVGGAEVYQDWGRNFSRAELPSKTQWRTAVPYNSRATLTMFGRDEWKLLPQVNLGAGIRYFGREGAPPGAVTDAAAIWNITGRFFARLNYSEGFRPPSLQACCVIPGPTSFSGNPDLSVERSRALEGELNLVTLEDTGPISRLYVRLDYSYTTLSGIIQQRSGQYFNRGNQQVHSVELLGRLELNNQSTLSLSYYFFRGVDEERGPLRAPANHILSARLGYNVLPWLELSSVFTAVGPTEDPNRIADGPNEQASMNAILIERLPAYYLLRAGARIHDLPGPLRPFELRVFGDNLLNQVPLQADTQSADKPEVVASVGAGWLVYADLTLRFGEEGHR